MRLTDTGSGNSDNAHHNLSTGQSADCRTGIVLGTTEHEHCHDQREAAVPIGEEEEDPTAEEEEDQKSAAEAEVDDPNLGVAVVCPNPEGAVPIELVAFARHRRWALPL